MANDGKYLTESSGQLKQEEGIDTSAGAGDASKLIKTRADGKIDPSLLAESEIQTKTAAETLAAGDMVHVKTDGQMEKANSTTNAKPATGYVIAGITALSTGELHGEGIVSGFTGLTVGAPVYLSTTGGEVTQTAPSASGNIVQKVGTAWSATEVKFEVAQPIELV